LELTGWVLGLLKKEWEVYPVLALFGIWYFSMIDGSLWNDEVIYATSASSILRGHIFINLEHPPIGKYIIAISLLLFGETELSVRLPAVIFGVLTLYLTYKCSRFFTDRKMSLVTICILGLTALFASLSTQVMLDIYLTFFVVLLLYCLLLFDKRGGIYKMRKRTLGRWFFLLGFISSLVVLSKLYGLFFAGAAFYLILRNWRRKTGPKKRSFMGRMRERLFPTRTHMWLWAGFTVPILFFYLPYIVRIDLVVYYLIGFNLAHVSGGHTIIVDGLEYTYPPIHTYLNWIYSLGFIFLVGFLVSIMFMIKDLWEGRIRSDERILLFYTLIPFVLLSIIYVKFDRYLLPMMPMIALMTFPLLPGYTRRLLDWMDPLKKTIRSGRARARFSVGLVILLIFITPSSPVRAVRNMSFGVDSHFDDAGDFVAEVCLEHPDQCITVISFYDQTLEYYLKKDHPEVDNYDLERLRYDSSEVEERIVDCDVNIVIDLEPNERFMDKDLYWVIRNECVDSYSVAEGLKAFTMKELDRSSDPTS